VVRGKREKLPSVTPWTFLTVGRPKKSGEEKPPYHSSREGKKGGEKKEIRLCRHFPVRGREGNERPLPDKKKGGKRRLPGVYYLARGGKSILSIKRRRGDPDPGRLRRRREERRDGRPVHYHLL